MASQYQHRQFFRRVPNALLARYFEARDVDLGVEFGDLTETQVEPVFEVFTALPVEQQANMEVDFQDINALATDGDIEALRNEVTFYEDENFPEATSAIDGYHENVLDLRVQVPDPVESIDVAGYPVGIFRPGRLRQRARGKSQVFAAGRPDRASADASLHR